MSQFSRKTILAATDIIGRNTHAEIDRLFLEHGLENIDSLRGGSKQNRTNELAKYLIAHPDRTEEDGSNLTDEIVRGTVSDSIEYSKISSWGDTSDFDYSKFQQSYPELVRGLERDGFAVRDGTLKRTLPKELDLPQTDDEVHNLLRSHSLTTPAGHLDQAIDAHSRGQWAAANSQIRTFMESLLDEIAAKLIKAKQLGSPGHDRRVQLAQLQPPFLINELNEWTGNGKGFVEGFYRRLHPQGSHPGLSDQDDATFRLHLTLIVARLLLKRLDERLTP